MSAGAGKRKFWNSTRREALMGYVFIIPEMAGILLLGVFSLVFSLYLSFTEWNLVGGFEAIHWIGLDNFKLMLSDAKFFKALTNNLIYTVIIVPVSMAIALLLAVIIHYAVYAKEWFKVMFFIPYIATTVAVATVFSALFHPTLGVVNSFLMQIGISDPPKWLGSTDYALWVIIFIGAWQVIGYNIIIFLAGLTSIPEDVYEAAEIDGAGKIQQFFRITVPLLGPTTFFLSITSIVASFKVFDLIAFLTEGGPNNATNVLVYYLYEEGFQNFRMGYASALSWVLFLVIAIITTVTGRLQKNQF